MTREVEERLNRRARSDKRVVWAVVAGVIIALLLALIGLQVSSRETKAAEEVSMSLSQQLAAACAADKVDNSLKTLCARANVIANQGPQGDPGPEGAPGPQGPAPTASQVYAAVVTYCTGNRCRGADGKTVAPTEAQIQAAVATYCANDACKGSNGTNGVNGANGADGAAGAAGERGPGPTDDQIASAVANYCSVDNRCRGEDGTDGTDGKNGSDGKDGRGITSVSCKNGNETFVITYTDGTTQEVQCEGGGGVPTPLP